MTPPPFQLKVRGSERIAQRGKKKAVPVTLPAQKKQNPTCERKQKSRRQKLREKNPDKYEGVREMDRIRSRLYRIEMTEEKRMHSNRLATIRQKRYRQNKKADEEARKKEAKKVEKGNKRTTRSEQEKKEMLKKKETERKRRYRQGQTRDQHEEHKRKRRQAYAEKIEKEQQQRRDREREKLRIEFERERNHMEQQNVAIPATPDIESRPTKPSSSAARRKRYSRLKKYLPSDGTHFAEVVKSMINTSSPQKVVALKRAGLKGVADHKRRSLEAELVNIVSKEAKKKNGRKYVPAALRSLKRARLQRYASKILGINRKAINETHKKKQGRKPVSMETINLVKNFFESMAQPLPDKKLVSKRTGKPRMVLTRPVGALHELFKRVNPQVKIGKSVFCKLRPKHVKPQRQARYWGCLCEQCENIRLKIVVMDQRLQGDGHEQLKLKDARSTVKMTLCSKTEGEQFHQLSCVKRNCQQCGMEKFDNHFVTLTEAEKAQTIIWRKWDSVATELKAAKKTVKRKTLVTKEGTVGKLLEEIRKEVAAHALHLFTWHWQAKQFQHIKNNLPENWVLNVWDFAENYTCFEQNEAQSAYWTRNQVTVHPTVNYYNCESQGCTETVCESVVFISSDNKHDFNAVHTYMDVLTSHLHHRRNMTIQKMVRFSDGCAAQYKSRGPLADVAHSIADYNFTTNHNFFGSRHGKGASDGESAVVKSQASMAVKSSTAIISNAKGLFDFCASNLERDITDASMCTHFRRYFYYIDDDDIKRHRERCDIKTIPGTRSLHSILSTDDVGDTIKTRKFSCFCEACTTNSGSCKNIDFVGDWKVQQLVYQSREDDKEAEASDQPDDDADDDSKETGDDQPDDDADDDSKETGDDQPDDDADDDSKETGDADLNEPATSETSGLSELTTGSYVAVQFQPVNIRNRPTGQPHVYVASVLEDLGNHYRVSFMKRNKLGRYTWPEILDISVHPRSDFVGILSQPDVEDRRTLVFRFPENELEDLAQKINGCLK